MADTVRILRGVPATVEWHNADQNGELAAAAGAVTVRVTRADGAEVRPAGTATASPGTGRHTVDLVAADTAELDTLAFEWSVAGGSVDVTTVEVVGRYYFSVAAVRAAFEDVTVARYDNDRVIAQRCSTEEEAEDICGVAFVPRFFVDRLDGTGACSLILTWPMVRRIRAVRIYTSPTQFTSLSADELAQLHADEAGVLRGVLFPRGRDNIEVHYEHGYDAAPAKIVEAAMIRLVDMLAAPTSAVGKRATTFTTEGGGTFRLDAAGKRKTGIREVDAVYDRYSERTPGIGT